jgi:hypothetical protein
MTELLSISDLPEGFEYPPEFVRIVELELTQLEPWWIIEGDRLRTRYLGLRKRYPSRTLVPFALRQDCDDVACFEPGRAGVVIVHDFASPGWEQRDQLPDFHSWLRRAIEDLIEFGG